MKLTMLGTGNALVTECYNTCFIFNDAGQLFLVDGGGGNGILHQLKYAGIDWKNIHEIFVTHRHYDHLTGILWLVRVICQFMCFGKYDGEVTIYAHDEVINLIRQISCGVLSKEEYRYLDYRLHLIEVFDGETRTINGRSVTFFDIHSSKAKQYGFRMSLNDDEYLACCGDEPFDDSESDYVRNCKWLMHEAFCLDSESHIFNPYERHHSTVKDACTLAEKMNVKNLILYHTEDRNIKNKRLLYTQEGSKYFSGTLYVPYDLDEIVL